jgi:hypothetical protein
LSTIANNGFTSLQNIQQIQQEIIQKKFPMDWEGIFDYIKFPAYMKPYAGGGWKMYTV